MKTGAPPRNGITACGYFVQDRIRQIDAWPQEEGLAEVLEESSHNGGGPSNILADLARMGAPFPLRAVGRVGDDEAGQQLVAQCAKEGVDASGLTVLPDVPTSTCDVMSCRETGRRTFFFRRGASARLDEAYIIKQADTSRIFYLGYPLLLDQMDRFVNGICGHASVLRHAQRMGQITAVDLVSVEGALLDVMKPVLPFIDHLFFNDLECRTLTGLAVREAGKPIRPAILRALEVMEELGLSGWAVLHMPEGCWARHPEHGLCEQGSVRLPPEQIKGANGAGDALAAGYLYALHEGCDVPTALVRGVCAASACLRSCSASAGVGLLDECLALGNQYGFRDHHGAIGEFSDEKKMVG